MATTPARGPRAVVLALGGATPALVERTPSLVALRERGTWCPIRSTTPPSAACAWTSFSTAQEPGRRARTLWEYLNDLGLSVGLYHLPGRCPPALNGWVVSGDEASPPQLLGERPVDVGVFYVGEPPADAVIAELIAGLPDEATIVAVSAYGLAPATGADTLSGLFLAVGPRFRRGPVPLRAEPSIMDVGPTLLHALGVKLPQDIDGRAITRAFDPAYLAEHPPKYSDAFLGLRESDEEPYSEEETDEVEKRLRDLGYM